MTTQVLKLGTRRSLLALAQSGWVAREIESRTPGIRIELIGIDTKGDKILDVPLQSLEGKDFFVAELDAALRSGAVDLTVHSLKDLSLGRPGDFAPIVVPRRANPRDVVLFGPGVREKISAGQPLVIGTSSPRRLENIPSFLERALPTLGGRKPQVRFVEIRGNVNTRLGRVHEPQDSPKHLDAVVLAFAGLIRLWADREAQIELRRLLTGVRWMILPLRENPTAPGQGALAVETRSTHTPLDVRVREVVAKIHDPESYRRVLAERALLAQWGGGCHQRFGATLISHPTLHELMFVRGLKHDGKHVEETRWTAPAALPTPAQGTAKAWDGTKWRGNETKSLDISRENPSAWNAVFVAHSRAMPAEWATQLQRVWTSGTPSWFRLAEQGVWIEGSAEGLGFDWIESTLSEPVLGLPEFKNWKVLTHAEAHGWTAEQTVATYKIPTDISPEGVNALVGSSLLFWTSGSQYDRYRHRVSPGSLHFCGPGKTAAHLKSLGLKPTVFPTVEDWIKWWSGKNG